VRISLGNNFSGGRGLQSLEAKNQKAFKPSNLSASSLIASQHPSLLTFEPSALSFELLARCPMPLLNYTCGIHVKKL